MSFAEITTLTLIMMLLAAMPSSSVALVVSRSASAGHRHGIAVAAGIVLADLTFMALAITGMSALAHSAGGFFGVIRVLCGLYLIWFGLTLFRQTNPPLETALPHRSPRYWASFFSGLLLTLGDIKAIAFYASLLPVFVDLASLTTADILLLAIVTTVAVGGVKLAYVFVASKLATRTHGTSLQKTMQRSTGAVMVGAGSWLILKP